MKRRGPTKIAVGVAVAGIVTALAASAQAESIVTTSVAAGYADIYTNDYGVQGAEGTTNAGVAVPNRFAGPDVNPGGTGQLLFAGFYDVREVLNPSGVAEPQQTNVQLINSAPLVFSDGSANSNEGILARVRFRESKASQEVLDFKIVLSCGQVWVMNVTLGAGGVPIVRSPDGIVTNNPEAGQPGGTVVYSPVIATSGQPFVKPSNVAVEDIQRGYLEVFAEERLPCEPSSGDERTGVYTRFSNQSTNPFRSPPNTLGGVVFIVRPLAGISYEYNMTAISRFVESQSTAGIAGSVLSPNPNVKNCILIQGATTEQNCIDAVDTVLSKDRLVAQWDELQTIGAQSYVVITQPTKHEHCAVSAVTGDPTGAPPPGFIAAPFSCTPTGEEIGCTIYNRLEDFASETNIFSPGDITRCFLPREVTIIGFVENVGDSDPRADFDLVYGALPDRGIFADQQGWLDIDLFFQGAHARGTGVGLDVELSPDVAQILGTGYTSYQGLPVISLVLQEYFNGNVGGVFGNAVAPIHSVSYTNS